MGDNKGIQTNRIGFWSLLVAVSGLIISLVGLRIAFPNGQAVFGSLHWWLSCLPGAFEAALVGSLADWFAVSALFGNVPVLRHVWPFASHMDLINRNRERLTDALASVVLEFVNPANLGAYLKEHPVGPTVASYIRSVVAQDAIVPVNSITTASGAQASAASLQQGRLLATEIRRLVQTRVSDQILHNQLVLFSAKFGTKTGERELEDELGSMLEAAGIRRLANQLAKKGIVHALRQALYAKTAAEREQKWQTLSFWVNGWIERAAQKLEEKGVTIETSGFDMAPWLKTLAYDLEDSGSLLSAQLNQAVLKALVAMLQEGTVRGLVAKGTEGRDLAKLFRQYAWNDLQYIRLNGAIVGFMTGFALTVLLKLIG